MIPINSKSIHSQWEHFPHEADMGIRGYGPDPAEAFAQAALALTSVVTDLELVAPLNMVEVHCELDDPELLLVDWLNAVIYEMATRKMLFSRYKVYIDGPRLKGQMWGEPVVVEKHQPAVEIKGATYTSLRLAEDADGRWMAQCVVDV